MKVAIVGAERTGKTQLAHGLTQALSNQTVIVIADNPAPDQVRQYDLTLLMGLDLPGTCNTDRHLRQVLDILSTPYAVVYGIGPRRLECALEIVLHYQRNAPILLARQAPSRWRWVCEKCSDADCEHQMFNSLISANSMQV
jgi:predicted GTPase